FSCTNATRAFSSLHPAYPSLCYLFFFNAPAPTALYTLSLHDALPILPSLRLLRRPSTNFSNSLRSLPSAPSRRARMRVIWFSAIDRKSTRLNSSHVSISYAVFCLKKKSKQTHKTAVEEPHTNTHPTEV